MLTPLPGAQTITTTERARELSLGRWERSREAATQGMIQGVQDSGIKLTNASGDEAWSAIIRHTVKVYLKSSNIRGLGEALSKIGAATGYLDTKGEGSGDTSETTTLLLRLLEKYLDRHPVREVIEGKTT